MNVERRWTRGAWLTLTAAAGLLFAPIAADLISLGYPTDGWTGSVQASGAYRLESQLTQAPSPLRAGDVIVALDGQPLRRLETAPLPAGLAVGREVRYTLERPNAAGAVERLEVPVKLVRLTLADAARLAGEKALSQPAVTVVPSLSFLVALAVFLLRPGNSAARYLLVIFSFYGPSALLTRATGHFYEQAYPLPLALLRLLAPSGWSWVFFPSWALLALSLPRRLWPLTRFPRLLPALLYGVPLALNAAYLYRTLMGQAAGLAGTLVSLLYPVILLIFLAAVFGGLGYNWRTLREPAARAQLRWIAFGVGVGWGVPIAMAGVWLALGQMDGRRWANTWLWLNLLLPAALAVAILRYRLFDIDVIIRRTLIYSALTAVLAAAYLGSVLVLQAVFRAVAGEGQNPLVVVLSTLAIAALFGPVRGRVQAAIDKRFYRKKYDAARTLAGFGVNVRDDVDLDGLQARLLAVVDETMQPAHASLWVKGKDLTA